MSIMFEINDFRTIYNMVVASFIILTCSLFYDSYMKKGEIVDMIGLYKFFMGTRTVLVAWISLVTVFYTIVVITKIAIKYSIFIWLPLYLSHLSSIILVAVHFSST